MFLKYKIIRFSCYEKYCMGYKDCHLQKECLDDVNYINFNQS